MWARRLSRLFSTGSLHARPLQLTLCYQVFPPTNKTSNVPLRDIVEVKFGPYNKNLMMLMAFVFVVLGIFSFTILEAGRAKKSAALAISACFIWAASVVTYNILVDHFTEGVNVEIVTARCGGASLVDAAGEQEMCL